MKHTKNPAAVALGRLNKGVKKHMTEAGKAALRRSLANARKSRWKATLAVICRNNTTTKNEGNQ